MQAPAGVCRTSNFQLKHMPLTYQNPPGSNSSSIAVEIWHAVLGAHKYRMHGYMNEVRRCLSIVKQVKPARTLPSLLQKLSDCLDAKGRPATLEELRMVILYADALCKSGNESVLNDLGESSNTKSLWRELGFLARVRRCVDAFTIACNTISNFEDVRFVPLASVLDSTARAPPARAIQWTVQQVFSSLNLDWQDRIVKNLMGPVWTLEKVQKEYYNLRSALHEVHAEVQLVLHVMAAEIESSQHGRAFRYIGCSKRSCFACDKFIKSCGGYTTRGCHGKLYHLWTVPKVHFITVKDEKDINNAIRRVEDEMKRLLVQPYTGKIHHARESTVGGTSVSYVVRRYSSLWVADLAVHHLEEDREASTESRTDQDIHEVADSVDESLSEDIIEPPVLEDDPARCQISLDRSGLSGECDNCERETSRHCSLCGRDWFCSMACQTKMGNYPSHLRKCCRSELTTADELLLDVLDNEIPKDEQVRADYGFSRCQDVNEESHLLGVYIGILKIGDLEEVRPSHLDEWRKRGELTWRIVEYFSQFPPGAQGSYYPWFRKNMHRLFDKLTPPRTPEEELDRLLNDARAYLSFEDRTKDPRKLQPPEKAECFLFFALALAGMSPPPSHDSWYKFGFSVYFDDPSQQHERGLGGMYVALIAGDKLKIERDRSLGEPHRRTGPGRATCSFEEFWQAWDIGNLGVLMERYQVIMLNRLRPSLSVFLSTPRSSPKPAIWRLIHFLSLEANTPPRRFPGMAEAIGTFGFRRGLDAKSKQLLTDFYRLLLGACDPMDLQQARDSGRLLDFVQRLERGPAMEVEVKRVLEKLK